MKRSDRLLIFFIALFLLCEMAAAGFRLYDYHCTGNIFSMLIGLLSIAGSFLVCITLKRYIKA